MSGKERLYAVTGRAVELIEHEWRNRRRVWIGLAVLLVLLSHFYILVSLNRITRELDRLNNDVSVMEDRMRLIAEEVCVSYRDWENPRYPIFSQWPNW